MVERKMLEKRGGLWVRKRVTLIKILIMQDRN